MLFHSRQRVLQCVLQCDALSQQTSTSKPPPPHVFLSLHRSSSASTPFITMNPPPPQVWECEGKSKAKQSKEQNQEQWEERSNGRAKGRDGEGGKDGGKEGGKARTRKPRTLSPIANFHSITSWKPSSFEGATNFSSNLSKAISGTDQPA